MKFSDEAEVDEKEMGKKVRETLEAAEEFQDLRRETESEQVLLLIKMSDRTSSGIEDMASELLGEKGK